MSEPPPPVESGDFHPDPHPYTRLEPAVVFDALGEIGLNCDGLLLALNSYENRVYQVGIEDRPPVIVKFYRPGRWSDDEILEEHRFVDELADDEIPVAPALQFPLSSSDGSTLHRHDGFSFAVFERRGGRAPELDGPGILTRLGRFIGRIHAVGARRGYAHRPALDVASFGDEPRDFLLAHSFIPADLAAAWSAAADLALQAVRRCFDAAGATRSVRLHGDCHIGNVLWLQAPAGGSREAALGSEHVTGPCFVDFDDSRMGPAVQDLWMLLSGSPGEMGAQFAAVLDGYEDFFEFDRRELHLIEALRTLRLIHFSAWLACRWDDPAFPAAFPWFNTPRYWSDRIGELQEQIALMDGPPIQPRR